MGYEKEGIASVIVAAANVVDNTVWIGDGICWLWSAKLAKRKMYIISAAAAVVANAEGCLCLEVVFPSEEGRARSAMPCLSLAFSEGVCVCVCIFKEILKTNKGQLVGTASL